MRNCSNVFRRKTRVEPHESRRMREVFPRILCSSGKSRQQLREVLQMTHEHVSTVVSVNALTAETFFLKPSSRLLCSSGKAGAQCPEVLCAAFSGDHQPRTR